MIIADLNVLVGAHDQSNPLNQELGAWLQQALAGPEMLGIPSGILAGFVRILTNVHVFRTAQAVAEVLDAAEALRNADTTLILEPGPAHWGIFAHLCRENNARGGLVQDAYWAAFAIERNATFVTCDGDFARFTALRWRHPLRPGN